MQINIMENTNIKESKIIINNKYNNIIIDNEKVKITKTRKYKKKNVMYVESMSIYEYIRMINDPSIRKTYIKKHINIQYGKSTITR